MNFLLSYAIRRINEHAESVGNPYVTFGVFGIITYPMYYLFWIYEDSEGYENLGMRLVVVLLCVLLALKEKWPEKARKFLPIFWYATICYSLPFLFTFLLLKNDFSYAWVLNIVTALILLVLLLDLITLSIILPLGIFLGWLCFELTAGEYHVPDNYTVTLMTYISAIVFGALFAHKIKKEKLNAASAVGASVAHELRTPLLSLQSSFNGIKRYLPSFLKSHNLAKEAGLDVDYIPKGHYNSLKKILSEADIEIQRSKTIIEMLLLNVNQKKNFKDYSLEICSINECINNTIERYPFSSPEQISLLHIEKGDDFKFKGNELLLSHVLFNLIKNSINFIGGIKNGKIYISTNIGKNYNYLYFKDTGKGIPRHHLPRLFTRFFTTTLNGTGLGLAFCKIVMEGFEGKIECESEEGVYTQFTLSFPKLPA